jgi:hypothetical protein
MLLIDGVKYELWTPKTEDEFEQVVKEHTQEIFSEQSIYLDRKQKLKSLSGIGSIPDGYVIVFGEMPYWHIVEVELSSHPLDQHIVSQVSRFITGIRNPSTQREIAGAIYGEITRDAFLKTRVEQSIQSNEIYKFLADLISKSPVLTIIIEKDTEGLREAVSTLAHSQIKVVEFQTFTRGGVGLAVHAHLFQPIYAFVLPPPPPPPDEGAKKAGEKGRKVTFEELTSADLLKDGQFLYFYHTQPFTDERAQVIVSSNQLKYERDGHTYSKSELARLLLIKHGFKHDEHGVAGPRYWKTEDGEFLRDLEEQIRSQRGDRG